MPEPTPLLASAEEPRPRVSIVVVAYDMPRALPRTLKSLSLDVQRHVTREDYEVIVVDNGSPDPVDPTMVASMAGQFRLERVDDASPSPAPAVNRGIAMARGEIVGVMIDGARLVTPGLVATACAGATLYPRAVCATLGWYLGHDRQSRAIAEGYDEKCEDALLASIDWPNDGYRLFEIGTFDESSVSGWVVPISESNALFMRRALWDELGGFDERFASKGGGYVNLDAFERACALPGVELVLLLGEATFHQKHGGISTNAALVDQPANQALWSSEYEALRGRPYRAPRISRTYLGRVPAVLGPTLARSLMFPFQDHFSIFREGGFDRVLWRNTAQYEAHVASDAAADEPTRRLIELAHRLLREDASAAALREACSLALKRTPTHAEARRLISLHAYEPIHPGTEAKYHAGFAEALEIDGQRDEAMRHYRRALKHDGNCVLAHLGLSRLLLPGEDYYAWIGRFHKALTPEVYVEIGVFSGSSICLASPPTLAVGIDPTPRVCSYMRATTVIVPETSDDFFARPEAAQTWGGKPVRLGFVDGLHRFRQAVRDISYIERASAPDGVILVHDTLPLDEGTSTAEPQTQFHTGDVWKVVPFLQALRPDLTVMTVATQPTGLGVIAGLNPDFDWTPLLTPENIDRFAALEYAWLTDDRDRRLAVVENDWDKVWARVEAARNRKAPQPKKRSWFTRAAKALRGR